MTKLDIAVTLGVVAFFGVCLYTEPDSKPNFNPENMPSNDEMIGFCAGHHIKRGDDATGKEMLSTAVDKTKAKVAAYLILKSEIEHPAGIGACRQLGWPY